MYRIVCVAQLLKFTLIGLPGNQQCMSIVLCRTIVHSLLSLQPILLFPSPSLNLSISSHLAKTWTQQYRGYWLLLPKTWLQSFSKSCSVKNYSNIPSSFTLSIWRRTCADVQKSWCGGYTCTYGAEMSMAMLLLSLDAWKICRCMCKWYMWIN